MSGRIANKLVALDDYVLYNGDMSSFVPRSSLDLRPIAVGPVARLPRTELGVRFGTGEAAGDRRPDRNLGGFLLQGKSFGGSLTFVYFSLTAFQSKLFRILIALKY